MVFAMFVFMKKIKKIILKQINIFGKKKRKRLKEFANGQGIILNHHMIA